MDVANIKIALDAVRDRRSLRELNIRALTHRSETAKKLADESRQRADEIERDSARFAEQIERDKHEIAVCDRVIADLEALLGKTVPYAGDAPVQPSEEPK